MALTILLTGFGPFPGAPSNPTGVLVQKLARLRRPALADVRLVPHVFPTSYRAVDRDLPQLLADVKPDAVLMFGLSARASCLRVETRARNALSAFRDVDGQRSLSTCIVPGGPAALPFGIPAATLALAARRTPSPGGDLARCRTLSLQLPVLARDRGSQPSRMGRSSRPSSMCPSCGTAPGDADPAQNGGGAWRICCAVARLSCLPPSRKRAGAAT